MFPLARILTIVLVATSVLGCPERTINRQPDSSSSGGTNSTDNAGSSGVGESSSGASSGGASGSSAASGASTDSSGSSSGSGDASSSGGESSSARRCVNPIQAGAFTICPEPISVVDTPIRNGQIEIIGGVHGDRATTSPDSTFVIKGGVRPISKE